MVAKGRSVTVFCWSAAKGAAPTADAGDEHLLDLERRRLEAKAQRKKLNDAADLPEDDPEDNRLFNLCFSLEKEIAKAPAHTATGVAIKIRLLQESHEKDWDVYYTDGFRTALEALNRLAESGPQGEPPQPDNVATMGRDLQKLFSELNSVERQKSASKDEAEEQALERQLQLAIRAVLDGIPPRGDDETIIAYCYRERKAIKRHGSRGMPDDEFNKWVDKHDAIEEAIGRHSAASLHDVEIKFSVLCDRLREDVDPHYRTEAATFMIAQCALEDLRRLVANT